MIKRLINIQSNYDFGGGDGGSNPPPISYRSFSWNGYAYSSKNIDKQKIVLIEGWVQHGYDYNTFLTSYGVACKAEKKNIWGNWKPEYTRIWLDGNCQVIDGETNPYKTLDINDHYGASLNESVYYSILPKGTYPNYHYMPNIPTSNWKATRWGGQSGIWARIINHTERTTN